MTSRELVVRTIEFQRPERMAYSFPDKYGTDFDEICMEPYPDKRPGNGVDEWGCTWENIGICSLGQIKEPALKDWKDLKSLRLPDVLDPARWEHLRGFSGKKGDKYIIAHGISIYERVHFIRGLENAWIDIYENPDELCELLDILVEMNIKAVVKYSEFGADGFMLWDDWGLQNRLMISPDKWREIWKPRYAKIFAAAHENGMHTILHSCGYIVDILDDLIEIGLNVINMDQQENMGLELLGQRFGGRITFFSPVDIQKTMASGNIDEIRAYCRKMVKLLGRPEGGLLPGWYADPVGAGHSMEAVDAMCEEFLKIRTLY